jgi:hypothetical protein
MTDIKEYLERKNIPFTEKRGELLTKCLFSNCDDDSGTNEAHLYFSIKTGQYHCKKCDASGNMTTLRKHLGDGKPVYESKKRNMRTLTRTFVERHHEALPQEILSYLYSRGISNEVIKSHKIGYGEFYGKKWITIPIKDIDGNYCYFKLRQDPEDGDNKMTWPAGEAQIYDWETLLSADENDKILICEGEMDMLLAKSWHIKSITNTHGANTVKDEWMEHFRPELTYYICYDNDDSGRTGAKKMAAKLYERGCRKIFIINFTEYPGSDGYEKFPDKYDLTDFYFQFCITSNYVPGDVLEYATPYPEIVDTSKFKEIQIDDVCKVLDSTIKKDDDNKAVTFLSMLTTYTEESQMNVFFNAPSSTGKSHIPLSVVDLFPKEDTIILAHCSPTAFFHEQGKYDKESNEITVDLSKKILIFTDMPDTGLIARLRSILSHDAKESRLKITDKNQKGGNKTKTVVILGYPSVYFCSAGLKVDEQESTRFLMLSPSIEHDKLLQGIQQSIIKESDREKFSNLVNSDENRELLKKRILAIKQAEISDVKIENAALVEKLFLEDGKSIKPRQQRDVKKVISLIKGFALLNLWFRKKDENYICATENDIVAGFKLWRNISSGQDYGLAPYVYKIYQKIILAIWNEPPKQYHSLSEVTDNKRLGVTRKEILNRHYKVYGRPLSSLSLRQHILPQLEQAGLIVQERSPTDSREMLVIPLDTDIEDDKPTEI